MAVNAAAAIPNAIRGRLATCILHCFTLGFLPPYSSELNPIERVWRLTRRLCLHNRYFATLDEVLEAAETQFAKWSRSNENPTVTMRNYLRRSV